MDYSLPSFFIHGIFQARVLEWGTIAFSEMQIQELLLSDLEQANTWGVTFLD